MKYFVSTTGADWNDGTEAYPWKTISHALQKADVGDEIIVAAGVYRSQSPIVGSIVKDAK